MKTHNRKEKTRVDLKKDLGMDVTIDHRESNGKQSAFIWRVSVTKVDNGYQVVKESGNPALEPIETHAEVFEQPEDILDDSDDMPEATRNMLWSILDHFGVYYSKHKKKNVAIKIEPGSDHVAEEKED